MNQLSTTTNPTKTTTKSISQQPTSAKTQTPGQSGGEPWQRPKPSANPPPQADLSNASPSHRINHHAEIGKPKPPRPSHRINYHAEIASPNHHAQSTTTPRSASPNHHAQATESTTKKPKEKREHREKKGKEKEEREKNLANEKKGKK
jgi:hypothetical protein